MRIYRRLLTKSQLSTENKWNSYFTDLTEFPLFNWIKCSDGEIIYTRKNVDPDAKEDLKDSEAWQHLYDQYIKKYGLSKLYKKFLSIMREKALMECTFVETRDRFKLTLIELKEAELKSALENNGQGMSIEQALVHLSKWLGYRLNSKEITVVEYFNILEQYGKANQKN